MPRNAGRAGNGGSERFDATALIPAFCCGLDRKHASRPAPNLPLSSVWPRRVMDFWGFWLDVGVSLGFKVLGSGGREEIHVLGLRRLRSKLPTTAPRRPQTIPQTQATLDQPCLYFRSLDADNRYPLQPCIFLTGP